MAGGSLFFSGLAGPCWGRLGPHCHALALGASQSTASWRRQGHYKTPLKV